MSLYREVGRSRRAIAIAASLTLLLGLIAGYALGRGTAPDPDLAEQIAEVGAQLRPALNTLDLVEIEYPQAFSPRGDVIAETELQAAAAHAASAEATLEAASAELEALDPETYAEALAGTERVSELIAERETPSRVTRAAATTADVIRTLGRL